MGENKDLLPAGTGSGVVNNAPRRDAAPPKTGWGGLFGEKSDGRHSGERSPRVNAAGSMGHSGSPAGELSKSPVREG